MFVRDPVILLEGMVCACIYYCVKNKDKAYKGAWMLLVPLAGLIINPLFNHRGVTTLFVMNNNPVTLEAALFGLSSGVMIAATLIWFATFTSIMTSDKLLYIFGAVSPKLALILSMTLRYIPLYRKQIVKTNNAQKALGLYRDDTAIDKVRGGMRVFSVMVTWALENGIITADSMVARGYGVGRRSRFAIFKWTRADSALIAVSVLLFAVCMAGLKLSGEAMTWFPQMIWPKPTPLSIAAYACFFILCLIPDYLNIQEEIRWRSLTSKI